MNAIIKSMGEHELPTRDADANADVARISARPGTADYDAQFNQQVDASLAAVWRMTLVRVGCGFGALMCAMWGWAEGARLVLGETDDRLMSFCTVVMVWPAVVWLSRVALRGKTSDKTPDSTT